MVSELERLSRLGSPWASASLAYLSLWPSGPVGHDVERALTLCKGPAIQGNAYALFVLAYAHLLARDHTRAAKAMLKASELGFPPATLAITQFAWFGVGTRSQNIELAMLYLRKASKLGHKASLSWRCALYRTGRLGTARMFAGYALTPYAYLRYLFSAWMNPFSESVLVFDLHGMHPNLRAARSSC